MPGGAPIHPVGDSCFQKILMVILPRRWLGIVRHQGFVDTYES